MIHQANILWEVDVIQYLAQGLVLTFIQVLMYLVFCIGSHVTLSRSDVKGATQGLLTLITGLLIFNWLTLWLGEFSLKTCQWLSQYCGVFYTVMLFALTLNGLVLVLLCLASLTGRLIQTKLKQRR